MKPSMLGRALGISAFRADLDMKVPIDEALVAMTQDDDVLLEPGRKLNDNIFFSNVKVTSSHDDYNSVSKRRESG